MKKETEYKYVVIRPWAGSVWPEMFTTADAAMRYADFYANARIFGLNPEYGFEVTRTLTVKP